jgi:DNA invertase Pin-like site-specific DNA recombinase
MATYLYSRVSTKEQSLSLQIEALQEAYPEGILVTEKESGKSTSTRPIFTKLIADLVSGDALVVRELSRLGRNTQEMLSLFSDMESRSVSLIVLNLGGQTLDATSATGKMILTIMLAVNTMERELLLERQAAGIAIARKAGKFKGKQANPKTIAKCKDAVVMIGQGLSKEKAAKAAGVGVATLYRHLKAI